MIKLIKIKFLQRDWN